MKDGLFLRDLKITKLGYKWSISATVISINVHYMRKENTPRKRADRLYATFKMIKVSNSKWITITY